MSTIGLVRVVFVALCLAAAFGLYFTGKEGAGWFIFFAFFTACSGDEK